jgi:drug/metabolite transporter (DMT)-like permease
VCEDYVNECGAQLDPMTPATVEPIFGLGLAWAILGQSIAAVQVLGGLIVVATVVWMGLRRR